MDDLMKMGNMPYSEEPAFPNKSSYPHGLTKREFVAVMAMQGLLPALYHNGEKALARSAVIAADALLEELSRKES
jgi:hypothetical protein